MSNIDLSMLELFKIELENHTKALEEGLITLETDQSSKNVEPLMRAAHSIKGAAKIVGLHIATKLAHSMEDVLSATGKGKLTLSPEAVDILLKSNDLFADLVNVKLEDLELTLNSKNTDIDSLIILLNNCLTGKLQTQSQKAKDNSESSIDTSLQSLKNDISEPSKPEISKPESNTFNNVHTKRNDTTGNVQTNERNTFDNVHTKRNDTTETPQTNNNQSQSLLNDFVSSNSVETTPSNKKTVVSHVSDSYVRIASKTLDKLMGFAGENLVQIKSMKPISKDLIEMKLLNRDLISILEYLSISESELPREINSQIKNAFKLADKSNLILKKFTENFENFNIKLDNISNKMYEEVISSRLRPFEDGLHGFSRMVRDLAKQLNKKIKFSVQGKHLQVDRDILEKLESPLMHLIRNAIDHGLETPSRRLKFNKSEEGNLSIIVSHNSGLLDIIIKDDGQGIDIEKLRQKVVEKKLVSYDMAKNLTKNELLDFLFLPGFSTSNNITEISGRGVGLDVVLTMLQEIRGTVKIDTELNKGTLFHLQLPISLSVIRTLIVEINFELYAIPLYRIDRVIVVSKTEIETLEDKQYYTYEGKHIGIIDAKQILNIKTNIRQSSLVNIIIISDRMDTYGLVVDTIKSERDLVVIPIPSELGKIPNISSGAILEDGSPLLIFDVDDVVRSIDNILKTGSLTKLNLDLSVLTKKRKSILVVDDSLTVREVERKLLESKGYSVSIAVDGMDGWNNLQNNEYDLIVSDIDMPRMNGIELVSKIKSHNNFKKIPVIIVSYKDREEDRIKGLEAGANYYLTKSSFHDETFINSVKDLIGESEG